MNANCRSDVAYLHTIGDILSPPLLSAVTLPRRLSSFTPVIIADMRPPFDLLSLLIHAVTSVTAIYYHRSTRRRATRSTCRRREP